MFDAVPTHFLYNIRVFSCNQDVTVLANQRSIYCE